MISSSSHDNDEKSLPLFNRALTKKKKKKTLALVSSP